MEELGERYPGAGEGLEPRAMGGGSWPRSVSAQQGQSCSVPGCSQSSVWEQGKARGSSHWAVTVEWLCVQISWIPGVLI